MTAPKYNPMFDEILFVIKRKRGRAKYADIKKSMNKYHNQPGGAEALHKHLAEMVAQEMLSHDQEKSRNGRLVDWYGVNNDNANDNRSTNNDNGNNASNGNTEGICCSDLKISDLGNNLGLTATISVIIDKAVLAKLLAPYLNNNSDNNNDHNVVPVVDTKELATTTTHDELEPFDTELPVPVTSTTDDDVEPFDIPSSAPASPLTDDEPSVSTMPPDDDELIPFDIEDFPTHPLRHPQRSSSTLQPTTIQPQ